MIICCCFRRKKKERKRRPSNISNVEEDNQPERETLKEIESAYTSYYLGCTDNTQLSYQTNSIDPDFLGQYNWYYGIISRMNAHELLRLEEDGTFLVRRATDQSMEYPYIISVKHKPPEGSTDKENYHYRIRKDENGYYTLGWNLYFKTVKDLLDYYKGKTDILKVPLRSFIDQNQPVR